MRFQKADILTHLSRQDIAYRAAILASHWLGGGSQFVPSAPHEARSVQMEVRGQWLSFADIANMLEDNDQRPRVTSDFMLNQLHALVRIPFELLRDYCEDYDELHSAALLKSLAAMDWYHFARLVRNAISHNFRYEFNERDRNLLPITWNSITLSEDMDGTPMSYEFGHKPGYLLFLEMRSFAELLPEPS